MFKLRDMQLSGDFTDTDLSNALMSVVTYTYGDRFNNYGFDIAPTPAEGAGDSGNVYLGPTMLVATPDATILVTEYASGAMGVIPMSSAEAAFVQANASLMQRIATLLGYSDYDVYVYTTPDDSHRNRQSYTELYYDFAALEGKSTVRKNIQSSANRGIYHPANTLPALFTNVNTEGIGDVTAPNGVAVWYGTQARIPLEYYLTDIQNVQDAARKAVQLNAAHADDQVATMTEALASVAALVGSLSVFGDTVKSVTDRYNNVTQYIPRP